MPQDTYHRLNEEKKHRVYQAVMNEFLRVPFEDVSIKNIINEAKIPRGSFYQYFINKEEALKFLISQTRMIGEENLQRCKEELNFNLYDFIEFIFLREVKYIEENIFSQRIQLLSQISKSPRATTLFFEDITSIIVQSQLYEHYWQNSGLSHLSDEERDVVVNLLFTSLRETLLRVLQDNRIIESARRELNIKIGIIREGTKTIFKNK